MVMWRVLAVAVVLLATPARAEETAPIAVPLYQYKPIYFVAGNRYTKVELSFKVPLYHSVPIYFGYTQLMFWDLFVSSPLFRDLNYAPEIFYRHFIAGDHDEWLDFSPYLHESNGRGNSEERSWNRAYLRYHNRFDIGRGERMEFMASAWVPYLMNPNNSDIVRFRGNWEISLSWQDFFAPEFEKSELTLRLYPSEVFGIASGGQELTLRIKGAWRQFTPLIVAQIFHGVGEGLFDYQQKYWAFRIGLGF